MPNKSKVNKNNRPLKKTKRRVNNRVVAEVVGCSPCTIVQVRSGVRNPDSYTGERIAVATMLLEEGFENVIINTKKLLNQ